MKPDHHGEDKSKKLLTGTKQTTSPRMNTNNISWYISAAQIPLLIFVLWLFSAYMIRSFPVVTGKRICLLIAHPDDEAMFFSPTLLSLTRPELGNTVVILCFSSGDADGLGHIRKDELAKSALQLGLRSSEHVVVLEDAKNFPDSMTINWDSKAVAQVLMKYFAPNISSTPVTSEPTASIDVLITFDEQGVSGHPNHISLYHGAKAFMNSLMLGRSGWESPVKMYTLTTTNVVRKYSSVFDAAATLVTCIWRPKERGGFPTPLLSISTPTGLRKGQLAMTTAHKSQMRWFRWGWIGVSRYMIVNDLSKQKGY